MEKVIISFSEENVAPVEVEQGASLLQALDNDSTPIQFGCKYGSCGTCLVQIVEGLDSLPSPDTDEENVLELFEVFEKEKRLCCQLKASGNLKLKHLGKPED